MKNQIRRIQNAIARMEDAAQSLIAYAEVVQTSTTGWERRTHRVELLGCARRYAAALNAVTRIRK